MPAKGAVDWIRLVVLCSYTSQVCHNSAYKVLPLPFHIF